jgi:hypothetical protein
MAIYGNVIYGAGAQYGQASNLPYSVEPLTAKALWYDTVLLNWVPSQSPYSAFRLLRNQNHLPETPEDGLRLVDWTFNNPNSEELKGQNQYVDNTQLVSGKYAYYRVWLLNADDSWVVAGEAAVLVPKQFGTTAVGDKTSHRKLMELLPRVITGTGRSPFDPVDYDSDLSKFLESFSFTYDELLTYIELLHPETYGDYGSATSLVLKSLELGVTPELQTITQTHIKSVREAVYAYQRKGTLLGLGAFVEAVSGFEPEITASPNILLSIEDSSFYKGTGSWQSLNGVTLTSDSSGIYSEEPASCDTTYVGKAVVGTAGASIINGQTDPIKLGAPVTNGTKYLFSFKAATVSGTMAITPKIHWFNYLGDKIATSTGTAYTATTSWGTGSMQAFAPGYSKTITAYQATSSVTTITFKEVHPFVIGDSILIFNNADGLNGTYTVTAVTSTTLSFARSGTATSSELITSGTAQLSTWSYAESATYAAIELVFGSTGTVYVDVLQLTTDLSGNYRDARCIWLTLKPSKINWVKNPSFFPSGTAWSVTATSSTQVTSSLVGVSAGLNALRVTPLTSGTTVLSTTTSGGIPNLGNFYTFSIYAKLASGTKATTLVLNALNSSTDAVVETASANVTLTNNWARYSVSLFVPITSVDIKLEGRVQIVNGTATIDFDAAQIEQSFGPTDYFDGSLPGTSGAGWYGTAHQSESYIYPVKSARVSRLLNEIEKYLPVTTSYKVFTLSGLEKAKITY